MKRTALKRKKKPAAAERGNDGLYRENILDHYRHPRNAGRLDRPSFSSREANYSCGDDVELFVALDARGRVADVRFDGHGCAISQAATSMLTEHVKNMTKAELARLCDEDVISLLGIEIGPSRRRCATLGFKALRSGLARSIDRAPRRMTGRAK